ncbi:MAG: hypothetical protein LBQ05_02545, partial [Christensenellaceae bacterium]|nr:hypothetical protein [Christensenellaceae bacterium]
MAEEKMSAKETEKLINSLTEDNYNFYKKVSDDRLYNGLDETTARFYEKHRQEFEDKDNFFDEEKARQNARKQAEATIGVKDTEINQPGVEPDDPEMEESTENFQNGGVGMNEFEFETGENPPQVTAEQQQGEQTTETEKVETAEQYDEITEETQQEESTEQTATENQQGESTEQTADETQQETTEPAPEQSSADMGANPFLSYLASEFSKEDDESSLNNNAMIDSLIKAVGFSENEIKHINEKGLKTMPGRLATAVQYGKINDGTFVDRLFALEQGELDQFPIGFWQNIVKSEAFRGKQLPAQQAYMARIFGSLNMKGQGLEALQNIDPDTVAINHDAYKELFSRYIELNAGSKEQADKLKADLDGILSGKIKAVINNVPEINKDQNLKYNFPPVKIDGGLGIDESKKILNYFNDTKLLNESIAEQRKEHPNLSPEELYIALAERKMRALGSALFQDGKISEQTKNNYHAMTDDYAKNTPRGRLATAIVNGSKNYGQNVSKVKKLAATTVIRQGLTLGGQQVWGNFFKGAMPGMGGMVSAVMTLGEVAMKLKKAKEAGILTPEMKKQIWLEAAPRLASAAVSITLGILIQPPSPLSRMISGPLAAIASTITKGVISAVQNHNKEGIKGVLKEVGAQFRDKNNKRAIVAAGVGALFGNFMSSEKGQEITNKILSGTAVGRGVTGIMGNIKGLFSNKKDAGDELNFGGGSAEQTAGLESGDGGVTADGGTAMGDGGVVPDGGGGLNTDELGADPLLEQFPTGYIKTPDGDIVPLTLANQANAPVGSTFVRSDESTGILDKIDNKWAEKGGTFTDAETGAGAETLDTETTETDLTGDNSLSAAESPNLDLPQNNPEVSAAPPPVPLAETEAIETPTLAEQSSSLENAEMPINQTPFIGSKADGVIENQDPNLGTETGAGVEESGTEFSQDEPTLPTQESIGDEPELNTETVNVGSGNVTRTVVQDGNMTERTTLYADGTKATV